MIAPISAGAGADTAARLLTRVLSDSMRQQVVIDHRPGAGSVLGTSIAAKATPDGYSVLWVSSAHATNAAFQRDLPYDSVRDFEPVALLARMPLILVVHQGFAAKSAPELLALLRTAPGKYNYLDLHADGALNSIRVSTPWARDRTRQFRPAARAPRVLTYLEEYRSWLPSTRYSSWAHPMDRCLPPSCSPPATARS